jgi:hypothetical protein
VYSRVGAAVAGLDEAAAFVSTGALRCPIGGGAAFLGYCRRAAADAADLAGFEAAEPIGKVEA